MLTFFRKHQRIFFIVVITFVIASFLFTGTFSPYMGSEEEVKDVAIGQAIDGSDLSKREVDELVRFLAASADDALFAERGHALNLLNDDVIRKDFLETGLGELLAAPFFDKLKPELEERLLRVRNFNFYAHPGAPFINVEGVWQQFQPEGFQLITALRGAKSADLNFFKLLSKLSVDKLKLPTEMVRRILLYQQNQEAGLRQDESLNFVNLNIFGFETLEDWLGRGYLQLVSQFIINASKEAEKRGYSISNKEVKEELLANLQKGLSSSGIKENASYADAKGFFAQQLRLLGLDESRAIKLWKKVMLQRRLFMDVGSRALANSLPANGSLPHTNEILQVEQYALPDSLRLKNFRSLLKFQQYIESIAGVSKSSLQLPKNFPTVQEVERRAPEFVKRSCRFEWREVKKEAVSQRISLKETWQWQGQEQNWQLLQAEFPMLAKEQSKTAAGRLQLLDRLNPQERLKIDRFSRFKIVDSHPEWMGEALAAAPVRKEDRGVRLKDDEQPFASALSPQELIEKLKETPTLSLTSKDGETIFVIKLLEMAPQNEVVSFVEASSDGTLDRLVDARLEEAYPEARKKSPALFQSARGDWKPFRMVADQVGALLYAPLLKAIEEDWKEAGHSLPEKEGSLPLEFYASRRLYPWMREMRAKVVCCPDDANLVQTGYSIEDQWKLKKSERTFKSSDKIPYAKEELFGLPEGGWSPVGVGQFGEVCFCKLKGRLLEKVDPKEISLSKTPTKEVLSQKACTQLMSQLLNEIIEKKAVTLL